MSIDKILQGAFKHSLFAQKKAKRVYKPKIGVIDLDHNQHGHIFSQTGYLKPKKGEAMIPRVWTCSQCGLIGVQKRFQRVIELPKAYIVVKCPNDNSMLKAVMQPRGTVTMKRDMVDFGLEFGSTYKVVNCPPEYMDRYGDCIWVYSDKRKEPVRLLRGEFSLQEED